MKKLIITLCILAIASISIITFIQPQEENISTIEDVEETTENKVYSESTVDKLEEQLEEQETVADDRTYTQEEANLFFGIVDGSVENSGSVTESDLDDFLDWLDTHVAEAETLEQNYIDTLVEAEEVEVAVEEEAVVETPAVTTPTTTPSSSSGSSGSGSGSGTTTTTPTVTTPTVTETPSTSSSNGGLAGFEDWNPGNQTEEELAQSRENKENGDFSIKLQ